MRTPQPEKDENKILRFFQSSRSSNRSTWMLKWGAGIPVWWSRVMVDAVVFRGARPR